LDWRHLVLTEPRQHLVTHRQNIERAGDRDRRPLTIFFNDPFIGVEVRVITSSFLSEPAISAIAL
jgi:hypothetical protein